jgi:integrase
LCKRKISSIEDELEITEQAEKCIQSFRRSRTTIRLLKYGKQEVSNATVDARLRYVSKYLVWRVGQFISKLTPTHSIKLALEREKDALKEKLTALMPRSTRRNSADAREGLFEDVVEQLKEYLNPLSPNNPWKSEHMRYRNCLIFYWFLYLGIRRGELLEIRIRHIDFRKSQVFIERRADDDKDPRAKQPNAKTNDRVLSLSETL